MGDSKGDKAPLLFPRLQNPPGSTSVRGALREFEDYIDSSKEEIDKVLIIVPITKQNGEAFFKVDWFNAGIKPSEMIAACEIVKVDALQALSCIPKEL